MLDVYNSDCITFKRRRVKPVGTPVSLATVYKEDLWDQTPGDEKIGRGEFGANYWGGRGLHLQRVNRESREKRLGLREIENVRKNELACWQQGFPRLEEQRSIVPPSWKQ